MPAFESSTEADAAILIEKLRIASLPAGHPLRELWESADSSARYKIHELADDVRVVHRADGAAQLFRQLRQNPTGFDDFRFELRCAAYVGRSAGQTVVRIAGTRAGPDVEARVRSGHLCGFACYRASSEVPALAQARAFVAAFVADAGPLLTSTHYYVDQAIILTFPGFPVADDVRALAMAQLGKFLARNRLGEMPHPSGIRLHRRPLAQHPRLAAETRRLRLRLQVAMPAWEQDRIAQHVSEKLAHEAGWARGYSGVAIFCLEESVFGQGSRQTLSAAIAGQDCFGGLISTYPGVSMNEDGIAHGFDRVASFFREPPTWTGRLDIGLETLGENSASWSDGHAMIDTLPATAQEDWDLVACGPDVTPTLVRPLDLIRRTARVPLGSYQPGTRLSPELVDEIVTTGTRLWFDDEI